MNQQVVRFVVKTPLLKQYYYDCNIFDDVVEKLHDEGFVNMGEIVIIKQILEVICSTPQIFNTNYL